MTVTTASISPVAVREVAVLLGDRRGGDWVAEGWVSPWPAIPQWPPGSQARLASSGQYGAVWLRGGILATSIIVRPDADSAASRAGNG